MGKNLSRLLLIPFSGIYGAVIAARNFLFDREIKKSVAFELPVIGVGNLTTGGTGKTPHVAYLVRLLKDQYRPAVLSRGYGRSSKGYLEVFSGLSFRDTGDEPLMIKRRFPDAVVAVCEERVIGIPILLLDHPDVSVVILDDAFQHRPVKPGLNMLLTEFSRPYAGDKLLPAGSLREPVSSAKRADIIIVTKCPATLSPAEKEACKVQLQVAAHQQVYFSELWNGMPYHWLDPQKVYPPDANSDVILLTGIARSSYLKNTLEKQFRSVHHFSFPDHHAFRPGDIRKILLKWNQLLENHRAVITTEKDAVRLLPLMDFIRQKQLDIYCIPVEVRFAEEERIRFEQHVLGWLAASSVLMKENINLSEYHE